MLVFLFLLSNYGLLHWQNPRKFLLGLQQTCRHGWNGTRHGSIGQGYMKKERINEKKTKVFRKQRIIIAVWKVTFRTKWECNKMSQTFFCCFRPFFGVSWSNSKTSKNQLACANNCPFFTFCVRLPNVSFSFFFAKWTSLQVYNKHIIFKSTRIY